MRQPSDEPQATTIGYYNDHAIEYCAETVNLNLEHLYGPFLSLIPQGARILDAGCGSGRDSLYFKQNGYQVTAFDASEEMVRLSAELIYQPVLHFSFQQLSFRKEFDGVWACASLLHVPRKEMDDVLTRLARALKVGGVLYASFKYGNKEVWRGERYYNFYDELTFRDVLNKQGTLSLLTCWQTSETRHHREDEKWLNMLMKRL